MHNNLHHFRVTKDDLQTHFEECFGHYEAERLFDTIYGKISSKRHMHNQGSKKQDKVINSKHARLPGKPFDEIENDCKKKFEEDFEELMDHLFDMMDTTKEEYLTVTYLRQGLLVNKRTHIDNEM